MVDRTHVISIPISVEQVPRFLDYFNVALSKLKFVSSHGEYLPDGGFREITRRIHTNPLEEGLELTWSITLSADGGLAPIEVSVEGNAPAGWQHVAEALIRETLIAVVNNTQSTFFKRYYFAYIGWPLDGEYYITGFRIAPSQPTSDFPFGLSEEVLMIDLNAEGVSATHASALGRVTAKKIAALLSVYLNIGLYEIPTNEVRWFYDDDGDSKCHQLGYKSSISKPTTMPRKGTECPQGQSVEVDRSKIDEINKPSGPHDLLHCPSDIRILFRTYYSLPPNEQAAFIGAASLFQISLTAGRHYPTVQMAYAVAAVDALTKEHTRKSFIELIRDYCPELPESDVENCYQEYRSAHFHAGVLPGGEYEPVHSGAMLIIGRDLLRRYTTPRFVGEAMRTVLIRWLLSRAP